MDLKNISNLELVQRMQKLVKTERKITHLVLQHILEIESRRIYAELGFDGMYTYLTRGLGYSEASAYRRLQSARLLKQVPEVAEKIESGALHLSQLTRMQKCLKEVSARGTMISSKTTLSVLEKMENKNTFQTEAVLSKEFDLPVKSLETLSPQADNSVRIELTLSPDQFAELEKAKDLLSHICHEGSWADVVATLAKKFNAKNDRVINPVQDHVVSEAKLTQRVIATKLKSRKGIPVAIRAQLFKKARGCCEYVSPHDGQRCMSKYQLQIDHVYPFALGGSDNLENLRVLCRTHNLLAAQKAGLRQNCVGNK